MNITFPEPPSDILAFFQGQENAFAAAPSAKFALFGAGEPSGPAGQFRPHRMFLASVDQMRDGNSEAFEFYGWRSLVRRPGGGLSVAVVKALPVKPHGEAPQLAHLRQGRLEDSSAAIAAALLATSAPAVAGGPDEFEFQYLSAPALHLEAIRLYRAGASRFIPVSPAPSGLTGGEVYEQGRFESVIAGLLAAKAASNALLTPP